MPRPVRLLGLVVALALVGCSGRAPAAPTGQARYEVDEGASKVYPVAERVAAPRVAGELLDGTRFDLATLRGQVVVVNFWASWCAPCRVEAPELEAVHQATKVLGVAFVGVAIRDDRDRAKAFQEAFAVGYPSLFDPPGKIALAFRDVSPNTIPTTVVIDRQARVAAVFRKALLRDELEPVVRRTAAESG